MIFGQRMSVTDLTLLTWASAQNWLLRALDSGAVQWRAHSGRGSTSTVDNAQLVATLTVGIFIGLATAALLPDQLVVAVGYVAPLWSIAMLQAPLQQRATMRLREQLPSQQAGQQVAHQEEQSGASHQDLLHTKDSLDMDSFANDEAMIPLVENALRHLHDRSYLGQHQLAQLQIVKQRGRQSSDAPCLSTHVSLGHELRSLLVEVIGQLRPTGELPTGASIPQREWHPYIILHSHYVQRELTREIMARLYISEGTYNRTRRSALRTVAKALVELEFQIESQSGCHKVTSLSH
jgi:hypothetical protein